MVMMGTQAPQVQRAAQEPRAGQVSMAALESQAAREAQVAQVCCCMLSHLTPAGSSHPCLILVSYVRRMAPPRADDSWCGPQVLLEQQETQEVQE